MKRGRSARKKAEAVLRLLEAGRAVLEFVDSFNRRWLAEWQDQAKRCANKGERRRRFLRLFGDDERTQWWLGEASGCAVGSSIAWNASTMKGYMVGTTLRDMEYVRAVKLACRNATEREPEEH